MAELQQAVQARAEWLEQAERGVLRGPTLAPLELALRRLRLARRGDALAEAGAALLLLLQGGRPEGYY